MKESIQRYLYRNTAWSLAIRLIGVALTFGAHVLLARSITQAEYGLFAYILDFAALCSVGASLGFAQSAVRFVPDLKKKNNGAGIRAFAIIGLAAAAIYSVVFVSILISFSASDLFPSGFDTSLMRIAAILLFAISALRLAQEMLRGAGRIIVSQILEQTIWPILFFAIIAVAWTRSFDLELNRLLLLQASIFILGTVILLCLLFSRGKLRYNTLFDSNSTRQWFAIGFPLACAGFLAIFLKRGDVIFLGSIVSEELLAAYSAAARIAGLGAFGLAAVSASMAPPLRLYWVSGDKPAVQEVAARTAALATILSLPLTFASFVFPSLIMGLFGPGFVIAASVLQILAIGQLVNAMTGPAAAIMIAAEKERIYLLASLMASVMMAVLLVFLVPELGLIGAAVAASCAVAAMNIFLAIYIYRKFGVSCVVTIASILSIVDDGKIFTKRVMN